MSKAFLIVAACLLTASMPAASQTAATRADLRVITVSGQGEVMATPDRASIQLGATAQTQDAAGAQGQVNKIVQKILEGVKGLGIPASSITTTGISLSPVYSDKRGQDTPSEPSIVGYRANNTVRVQLDDLSKVGAVIDAGVEAGANTIQDLSFDLKDDTAQRQEALKLAVRTAQSKAQAIAEALNVKLGRVQDVSESGVSVIRPFAQERYMAAAAAAPVEPGQLRVQASVTINYLISDK